MRKENGSQLKKWRNDLQLSFRFLTEYSENTLPCSFFNKAQIIKDFDYIFKKAMEEYIGKPTKDNQGNYIMEFSVPIPLHYVDIELQLDQDPEITGEKSVKKG